MTADQPSRGATPESDEPAQLRVDVERARARLGETMAALANKADLKGRAKNATRRTTENVDGPKVARGAAAAACAAGTAALAVWVWRRRLESRRATRWQRTMRTAQQTGAQVGEQMRGKAADVAAAVRSSELPGRVATQGQVVAVKVGSQARKAASQAASQAAESPAAKPAAQGAVPMAAILLVLWWMRRRRVRRRHDETT